MIKKLLSLSLFLFSFTFLQSQTFNAAPVDSVLNANLTSVFHNKVVCMVKHNDSLVYYYHQGADTTTIGGIASCTKTFSAALMLRLVQDGTIQLDDSIAQYYPFATVLGKGSMTLRNLFAHTSGLSGSTNYNSNSSINLQQSADSIIRNDALQFPPIGSTFSYTGEDQQVAGAAAELAAGASWNNLFASKIAAPLGLTNTTFFNTTPTNPRIAGGIRTNAADMLRLGQFIFHNGKSSNGTQVVDSMLMQELWKDQTNHAIQASSPYPFHPPYNNPYNDDTIYYGVGTWLDIYNPVHQYQEQISADGAFGGIIWINRCTNTVGVFMTFLPSTIVGTQRTENIVMDMFRTSFPFTCYSTTVGLNEAENKVPALSVYPNPSQQFFTVELPQTTFDLTITDITGRLLIEQKNVVSKMQFDCGNYSNGIYFINAKTGVGDIKRVKIVIAK